MGPRVDPFGFTAGCIQRRLEIIKRQLPVFLLEIYQSQIVINPGIVTIELEGRLELLLRFGVLPFSE